MNGVLYFGEVVHTRSRPRRHRLQYSVFSLLIDLDKLESDLGASWEVLTEAVQTAMRKDGMVEPYEQLKNLTRGRQLDEKVYNQLIDDLELSVESAKVLKTLTPSDYTGLAHRLAEALANDDST